MTVLPKQKADIPLGCRLFCALLITLLLLLSGCSAYAPELLSVRATELYILGSDGNVREELILDLQVRDQDGFAELDTLYLSHSGGELYWEVPAENWNSDPEAGTVRIGRLAAPPEERLPRGRYTVTLYDLGGRSGEGEFTLPLLPEQEILEAEQERLTLVAEGVRSEKNNLPELDGIALIWIPSGLGAQQLLELESLEAESPSNRLRRLRERLDPLRGEGGRFYYALRIGEAGPLLLLREEFSQPLE